MAAHKAASIARERRMADVERTATDLLERVRARAPGIPEAPPPENNHVDEVVRTCHLRLRQWTGPKRGRPPGDTPPV